MLLMSLALDFHRTNEQGTIPELIALSVSQNEVRQIFHDSLSRSIHQVECAAIIGLDEVVLGRESAVASMSA